jgi:hypothetical protein
MPTPKDLTDRLNIRNEEGLTKVDEEEVKEQMNRYNEKYGKFPNAKELENFYNE